MRGGGDILIEAMKVPDVKSTVRPKYVKAIKTAVIPDALPALIFPIIQSHHRRGRRVGIMTTEPLSGLRQGLNLDLARRSLPAKQRNLAGQPRLLCAPAAVNVVFLSGLGVAEGQRRLNHEIIHEPRHPVR